MCLLLINFYFIANSFGDEGVTSLSHALQTNKFLTCLVLQSMKNNI